MSCWRIVTMADYILYAESCNIKQKDMVETIKKKWPFFSKEAMSLASNPERNALQLVPAAEELLVAEHGVGPGLSISPRVCNRRNHENKNKPHRLCVRLNDSLRSRVQNVYERMAFTSMQDLLEAAITEFVGKYDR